MDYKGFKNELQNYYKHLENIDRINEDIDKILYEMTGVKGVRYDKAPSMYNPELASERRYELSEMLEEKEIELDYTVAAVKYIEMKISKLSKEDKQICIDIISKGISAEKIAKENGYSRSGIWARIKRELSGIL